MDISTSDRYRILTLYAYDIDLSIGKTVFPITNASSKNMTVYDSGIRSVLMSVLTTYYIAVLGTCGTLCNQYIYQKQLHQSNVFNYMIANATVTIDIPESFHALPVLYHIMGWLCG